MPDSDPQRTRRAAVRGPRHPRLHPRARMAGERFLTPAAGDRGIVYAGAADQYLYAVDPDGTVRWRAFMRDWSVQVPIPGPDGLVVLVPDDSDVAVIAYDGLGEERWWFRRMVPADVVLAVPAQDGTALYVASDNGVLQAAGWDGVQRWHRRAPQNPIGLVADGAGPVLAVASRLVAYDAGGGRRWVARCSGPVAHAPVLGPGGRLYAATARGGIHAVEGDGTPAWSLKLDGVPLAGSPAVATDGTVYAATVAGTLFAIGPDGKVRWRRQVRGPLRVGPTVSPEAVAYVGAGDLLAIGPDGAVLWEVALGLPLDRRPALGPDGTLYVGSDRLYAIGPDGTVRWALSAEAAAVDSTLLADGVGRLYAGLDYRRLHAVERDGATAWSAEMFPDPAHNPYAGLGPYDHQRLLGDAYLLPSGRVLVVSDALGLIVPPGPTRWTRLGARIRCSAVSAAGAIYLGCTGEGTDPFTLLALDGEGAERWRVALPSPEGEWTSISLGTNGTAYVCCRDGRLCAVSPDGGIGWVAHLTSPPPPLRGGEDSLTSPSPGAAAVGSDGTIYVTTRIVKHRLHPVQSGFLHAIGTDGLIRWRYRLISEMSPQAALAKDGTIYVIDGSGTLHAIAPDGTPHWMFQLGKEAVYPPTLDSEGTIYIATQTEIRALLPDRFGSWSVPLSQPVSTDLILDADGAVCFGSSSGTVYAIEEAGVE